MNSVLLDKSMGPVSSACKDLLLVRNLTTIASPISLQTTSVHSTSLSKRFHDDPFHHRKHRGDSTLSAYCIPYFYIRSSDLRFKYSEQNRGSGNKTDVFQSIDVEGSQQFLRIVDQAANEIRMAGIERGERENAQKMSHTLLNMKGTDEETILEYCVKLYTTATFLYRACHRDLKNYYSYNDAKVSNYIELLNRYMEHWGKSYTGTVYRGASVDSERLKWYLVSDIDMQWYSSSYLSTSKSRRVAELLGNVLFVIDIKTAEDDKRKAIDISTISALPDEEEVLIAPEFDFYREKESEFDPTLNKHIVYLTTVQSFKFPRMENVDHDIQPSRSRPSLPSSSPPLKHHHGLRDSSSGDESP